MKKERLNEIWGIFFLLTGLFALASLFFFDMRDVSFYTSQPLASARNTTGVAGAYLAFGLFLTFGISAYVIPGVFLLWSFCFFSQRVPERKLFKFVGLAIALFATATLVTISSLPADRLVRGGAVGYAAGEHLLRYFGAIGGTILASACLLLSVLLATDFLIYPLIRESLAKLREAVQNFFEDTQVFIEKASEVIQAWRESKQENNAQPAAATAELRVKNPAVSKAPARPAEPKHVPMADVKIKVKAYRPDIPDSPELEKAKKELQKEELKNAVTAPVDIRPEAETVPAQDTAPLQDKALPVKPVKKPESSEDVGKHDGVVGFRLGEIKPYELPNVNLLRVPLLKAAGTDNLEANSRIMELTLAQFGIEVKVVEVEQGPVITRYELLPAPGVKVNSIASLSDDLALALKATSIRLIIPIPGKSAIGVEVPNSVSSTVSLRELIESRDFKSRKNALPLVLGKTTSGASLVSDLATMPHILIAGSTGSGKTVAVNSIIMGLLYHATPDDLKFVMVDPKMVEMACYNKLPHMLAPVVTDSRKAAHTLNWVVSEMENRYRLFAAVGVRNIQAFNGRPMSEEAIKAVEGVESENVIPHKLPYIVVVIDELADLMLVAQDKVESAILRLAQLARATGIHLILATQRPSVDVITGVIKANFPARISFKVASKVDSRTVLDCNGADQLIGKGDMLFLRPGEAKPIRGQAPYVTDDEINAVVKFWTAQGHPDYLSDIISAQDGRPRNGAEEKDELFDEAVAVVLETGQASTSNLQRRMRLGYTRAARIIDQMEAEGLVGPAQGAKPREIYTERFRESSNTQAGTAHASE